jgi:uncharacterized damage-inducible protein DinB
MSIATDILIEQFNACYDDNGWFVALKNALANMTAEQALWKPSGTEHSVWEAVYHLTYWNERWLKRYRGETLEKGPIVIAETFKTQEHPTEAGWHAAQYKLFGVMDALKAIVENITDSKLDELVSESYGAEWKYPLANMMVHNAYHIGQIVMIRKFAGNWDASKGVS